MILEALVFPLLSHHISPELRHQEVNPGLLAEVRIQENRYALGAYRNSYSRTSLVALRRYPARLGRGITAGASLGLCSGYRQPVCGFVSLELASGPAIAFAPSFQDSKGTFILLWRQPL